LVLENGMPSDPVDIKIKSVTDGKVPISPTVLFVMYEQCLIEKLQINANISTDIK
jgi:hypothetical protein